MFPPKNCLMYTNYNRQTDICWSTAKILERNSCVAHNNSRTVLYKTTFSNHFSWIHCIDSKLTGNIICLFYINFKITNYIILNNCISDIQIYRSRTIFLAEITKELLNFSLQSEKWFLPGLALTAEWITRLRIEMNCKVITWWSCIQTPLSASCILSNCTLTTPLLQYKL
jgi:hypothetical protein